MLIPKESKLVKSIGESIRENVPKKGTVPFFVYPWKKGTVPFLSPFYSMMELATMFATRLLMDAKEPPSSGWTLFVRNITKVSVSGSIQMEVPV